MSLVDEALAGKKAKGPSCTAGKFLARLTDDQQAEIAAAEAQGVPATALCAAMDARGWGPPKSGTWSRHKRGECCCG